MRRTSVVQEGTDEREIDGVDSAEGLLKFTQAKISRGCEY
jgi:hypothetical protein